MAGKGGYESGGNGKETGGKGNRGKEITMVKTGTKRSTHCAKN